MDNMKGRGHSSALVDTVSSEQGGLESWLVWSLHVPSVTAWVFPDPPTGIRHIKLIRNSKFLCE